MNKNITFTKILALSMRALPYSIIENNCCSAHISEVEAEA